MCSGDFYNMSRRFTLIFKNNQVIRVFIRAYVINIWIRKSEAGVSKKNARLTGATLPVHSQGYWITSILIYI